MDTTLPQQHNAPHTLSHSTTDLVPYAPAGGMLVPLATPAQARQAVMAYEAMKSALAYPSDYVNVKGKTFLKKAFWRRIALAFGISCEVVREERHVEADGLIRYAVLYRATAPNGQYSEGDGHCDSLEFGPSEHNVRAKAHTRAKNRAIADLIGGGEVSADELGPQYYAAH